MAFSLPKPPEYEATVRLLIGQERDENQLNNLQGDIQGLQELAQTMVELIASQPVAEEVTDTLDLQTTPGALLRNLSAQQIGATQLIEISYEDTDAKRARLVANTVGEVFSERLEQIGFNDYSVTVTVWEPAIPNYVRNGLIALALGLALGVGLAFMLDSLDDRWRSLREVERIAGVSTLAAIPRFDARRQEGRK